jgi:cytochrome c peroxidase
VIDRMTKLAVVAAIAACNGSNTADLDEVLMEAEPVSSAAAEEAAPAAFNPRMLRRFKPLRETIDSPSNPRTPEKIALGRMLFYEKRISRGHDVSCNSCHRLADYGVDGEGTSAGHKGQRGSRNSPSVYTAAASFVQFWDGRAGDIEAQALGPITNPIEMAAPSLDFVVATLESMPGYVEAFERAFPGDAKPVSSGNIAKAIGAFERGLTTRSRWDAYLEGDTRALDAAEVEGLRVFTNVGCMVCHTGELVGGSMFERAGAVEPWPRQKDQGRFELTKRPGDEMMFKVPTLRNVTKTGPYFHDGSATTLPEAVVMMGRHQLGLELDESEVSSIVTWLGSLTGELPRDYIQPPELPESTAKTPQPE